MTDIVLKIYDYLHRHTMVCVSTFGLLTAVLVGLVSRIDFNEDISAFLPLDENYQQSLRVYQDISGANKVIAIFQSKEKSDSQADSIVQAMNQYETLLAKVDSTSIIKEKTTQIDYNKMSETIDFIYQNIPYFLTEKDYARMDSLLSIPAYTESRLQEDLQALMFPTSGILTSNLENDPLNLFEPVVSELYKNNGTDNFELYDGYIFTQDLEHGIVVLISPYGNSETKDNTRLMKMLNAVADSTEAHNPTVSVHYTGGPAIAVGNSKQIKQDCLLSVSIAVLLILAFLFYAFRSPRNILLIVISISWGWLYALGVLSIFHESISMIVVGISSIIVGIAVNYPLHLIAHARQTLSMRQTLQEIISPLVIGNITTVGAFCALIPLQAAALRDLGIFSALLLVGTILFVVIWLPHIVKVNTGEIKYNTRLLDWIGNLSLENNKWGILLIGILTLIFGWFSFGTQFDANMNHINYMTDEQRTDMEFITGTLMGTGEKEQILYVVSKGRTMDEALNRSEKARTKINVQFSMDNCHLSTVNCQLYSKEEQTRRIQRWKQFTDEYTNLLGSHLTEKATAMGFSPDAFAPFGDIIRRSYCPMDYSYFKPLQDIYAKYISIDSIAGLYCVVDVITTENKDIESIRKNINAALPAESFCFDIKGMNSALANNLTDNFNYVGWACAAIVFLFLWFSFRSLKLAVLTFLPMTISWIWILGIMTLLGIQFNLVNVILATFIFGQGDDYTIFVTEGCLYEQKHGKKMLALHKRSIALSALIMFIGIGSLIFAKHPALHSLAEITIVGMFSVVLMAYVIPPLLFRKLRVKSEE